MELTDFQLEHVVAGLGARRAGRPGRGWSFDYPYNPTHRCPVCGRTQFVIDGFLPNGQHRHCCSKGHCWKH